MSKQRIIVNCPGTGIAVITNIAYEDISASREKPILFRCPCGETHKLEFAGRHSARPRPLDHKAS